MRERDPRLVLVVEDDDAVRRPLVKFFEMHGFATLAADATEQGLDLLEKHRISAAVVDLRLTHGSGLDVVAAIPPGVPVIIFSGDPSELAGLESTRAHTRLIEKPFSLAALVQTLERMLADSASENLHP